MSCSNYILSKTIANSTLAFYLFFSSACCRTTCKNEIRPNDYDKYLTGISSNQVNIGFKISLDSAIGFDTLEIKNFRLIRSSLSDPTSILDTILPIYGLKKQHIGQFPFQYIAFKTDKDGNFNPRNFNYILHNTGTNSFDTITNLNYHINSISYSDCISCPFSDKKKHFEAIISTIEFNLNHKEYLNFEPLITNNP